MRISRALTALGALFLLSATAATAQTVKVGFITSFSGQNASIGAEMDQAVKLWTKLHEKDLPPGVKIEILRRDDTGPLPEVAKRLAQDLITRDHVDILTGVVWTPNAFAIGPLAGQAKVPFIIMNAGTSAITTTSPYVTRVSFTLWQSSLPMGEWAAKHGIKKAFVAVSDFGAGWDAQEAFTKGFTSGGGQVVEAVRMPLATQDFVPYMQKAKDLKPDAVFSFIPGGKQATALMKAFNDAGLKQAGIKLIGPGDLTTDEELQSMGDVALGVETMHHYSAASTRPANVAFIKAWKQDYGQDSWPGFPAVGAWDGMAAIYHVVIAQKGKMNGDKTMELLKGWTFKDSPRGPFTIDPETRDIIQTEYVRRVERVDGHLANIEFDSVPMVKDPWKELNQKK
jgi:branched-chain amino acid transport system substrate-binding protein